MPSRRSFLASVAAFSLVGGGAAAYTGTVTMPGVSPVWERWQRENPKQFLGEAIALEGDRLFVAREYAIEALDATTGSWRWDVGAPERPYGGIAVCGAVYGGRQELISIARDGTERWRVDLTEHFGEYAALLETPVIAHDYVVAGVAANRVAALATDDGAVQWERDLGDYEPESFATGHGAVYVALRHRDGHGGRLLALEAGTGRARWKRAFGEYRRVEFATGDALYATVSHAGAPDAAIAFDPDDGSERWRVPLPFANGLTLRDGVLYAVGGRGDYTAMTGTPGGALLAIDAERGKQLWRRDVGQYGSQPPAVGDGRVYVVSPFTPGEHGSYEGLVLAYTTDGEAVWRHEMGEDNTPVAAPVYHDGTLYVGGDRLLLALADRDW